MSHRYEPITHHMHRGYLPDVTAADFRVIAKCGVCGTANLERVDPSISANQVRRIFNATGWLIGERDPATNRCPTCLAKSNQPKPRESAMVATVNQSKEQVHPLNGADSRVVGRLLDDYFDPEKGTYTDGYSDERIAKEANISAPRVKKHREEGWGTIKVDTEIEALQCEINAVKSLIEGIQKNLLCLQKKRAA